MSNPASNAMDALSLGLVLGTMTQVLPTIAAFLSIVWFLIRIYEWYKNKKMVD